MLGGCLREDSHKGIGVFELGWRRLQQGRVCSARLRQCRQVSRHIARGRTSVWRLTLIKRCAGRLRRRRRDRLFVVYVDAGAARDRVDLDIGALEKAGHAAGQAFAPVHDDRVGAKLVLDLSDQVLDGASVVGAYSARFKRG